MKRIIGLLFLFWAGVILIVYYVAQKPGLRNAFAGLADTFWTLIVAAILLYNAYGIGRRILHLLKFESQDAIDHLLLSSGIGLGSLGLFGLFFSVLQLANETILTIVQIALAVFLLFRNDLKYLRIDLHALSASFNLSLSQFSLFTKLALFALLTFSFLLTLVPPFEAFDALLYHLALPAKILGLGGLQPINNSPFWHPGLSENVYLWVLGMGSERAPQIVHFTWLVLSALTLWHWAAQTWNLEIGRKTLLLLAAIPSLPMLASWAYADMSLVYYAVAAIYSLTRYRIVKASSWLNIAAIMAGFTMSIKYTAFVVPLTCGLLLLTNRPFVRSILFAAQFSFVSLAVAAPWYIRNAVFMGNPFYPFVFTGRYWDSFLAHWYADAGTGIGWNALQIILLPFNATLGTHDVTFFDGRIGPLFLLLAPFSLWVLWTRTREDSSERESLLVIGVFSVLSYAAWTFGVISSSGLWQARLLFPALVSFTIPTALAWDSLKQFNTSKLQVSVLANMLISIVIALTIFDNGLFVLQRNPLLVALGAQSRERYIERINPSYAALMRLVDELPPDAHVYLLFEPRSYGLPRTIQADPLIYNFAHDVYLYKTPDAIIQSWKSKQYTYIIVYERGLDIMEGSVKFTPTMQNTLQETLGQLTQISQTPDQVYSLYKIP